MKRGCLTVLQFAALAGALLWLSWCGVRAVGRSWFEAARENAAGVARLKKGQPDLAAAAFERSAAYRCRAAVPLTNLGLARLAQQDAPEAHAAFERALREDPREATALFGDGAALYGWGSALADFPDPADPAAEREEACARAETLRKAITYWEHARTRFRAVAAGDSRLAVPARENAAFLQARLETLRAREARYRKICESSCANQASGKGGGSAPRGGGGAAGAGGGNPAQPPPPAATGAEGSAEADRPLTAEEKRQVGESLRKQREQRRDKDHYHRQSAPQQWRPKSEEKGRGGQEVLW